MLTPIFSITQDNNYLFITIKAPNARVSETEIYLEDQDFRFFSNPYYLRLSLPSKIIENGEELAKYDSKSGTFLVKVSKHNSGEHFEGLDLLTKLLSNNTNKQINRKNLIEVIDEQQVNTEDNIFDEEFDWHLEQNIRYESDELSLFGEKYGFADQYSGVIARITEEFSDLIDIKDPEHKNSFQRREDRLKRETLDFSDDHYLSDMFDQKDLISNIISFQVFDINIEKEYEFKDEQRFRLKNLPKKEYIFDKTTKKSLLLSMIDILFAYAYDMRVNECEPNVESGWNICKLSATLSWFDSYSSLKEVVVTSIRRSLCYPIYRDWKLSLKVFEDVINILKFGQNYVLKCFLDINKIFNESGDGRYLLNDIFITDYCVWLQYIKQNTLQSLVSALQTIKISKSDVNLDLDILERAAHMAIEEHNCPSNISQNSLNHNNSDSSDENSIKNEEIQQKSQQNYDMNEILTLNGNTERILNSNELIDSDDDPSL